MVKIAARYLPRSVITISIGSRLKVRASGRSCLASILTVSPRLTRSPTNLMLLPSANTVVPRQSQSGISLLPRIRILTTSLVINRFNRSLSRSNERLSKNRMGSPSSMAAPRRFSISSLLSLAPTAAGGRPVAT
jgi:hypothetical protein